jgi:hypothetical protein
LSAQDPRDLAPHAKVSLRDAIGRALVAKPGRAVEAELALLTEGEKHQLVYEVDVLDEHNQLFEVVVDAASGQAGPPEQEQDEDAAQEAREFRRVLRHCELDLAALVAKGEEIAKGAAVAACLELDEGPECDLLFVNTRYLLEMTLEARAGHLLEIELAADEAEGDDDEEEGEDGEEGDADEDGDEDKREEMDEEDEGEDENEGLKRVAEAVAGAAGALLPAPQGEGGPSKAPLKGGVRFSAQITHPYFPLSQVRHAELASEDETVVLEVQEKTRQVAGVECLVLAEKEYEDGELAEISYNYFAQDPEGNVYYFGEDVDDYQDGKIVSHGGAWLVGKNATEPCLYFPAKLEIGFRFMRENAPPEIHEYDMIAGFLAKKRVPSGELEDVLSVRESDVLGRWQEVKFYARGVGLISENDELVLRSYKKSGGVD